MRAAGGSRPGPMVPPEMGPMARNEARGAGARRGVRAARRAVPLVAFVLAGAGLAPRAGRPARHWPSRHGTETVNVSSAPWARCFLVSAGPGGRGQRDRGRP